MDIHKLAKIIHKRLEENKDGEYSNFHVIVGALSDWEVTKDFTARKCVTGNCENTVGPYCEKCNRLWET